MRLKTFTLAIIAVLLCLHTKAQWTNKSFTFETKLRQYREYVSPNYNPSNPASLVITLHGLGDNMTNFSQAGMDLVADTANIIVLVPQALVDPIISSTAWNSRAGASGYYPNSTINDVGFLNALIDTASSHHVINPSRVYLCGLSMGGFMTERMACESNQKIAAFASVAGTIGSGISQCNPGRPVPVAHFHGTADQTVGYYTNAYGLNVDSLIHLWIANDQCDTAPVHTNLPDLVADGYTVEHFLYPNGLLNSSTELFKVNGAPHTWLFKPLNDISYTEEIWKFFSKHQLQLSIKDDEAGAVQNINVYPNPAYDCINIKMPFKTANEKHNIELFTMQGAVVFSGQTSNLDYSISLNSDKIRSGIYLLHISGSSSSFSKLVSVEK